MNCLHQTHAQPRLLPRAPGRLLTALLLAGATGIAIAQPRDADQAYQQERAACLNGSSAQDRATCLKEADAARSEAKGSKLDNGESATQLRANALQRCQRVKEEQRAACERLARGEGERSGSVAEGAVLRQITIRSAGPGGPAAASGPAPAASR